MQELRACDELEAGRALLDQPQSEVHVAEQSSFVGLAERGACS
jgi:hypothetical protein